MCDCTAPLCKECQAKDEREWDALETRVAELEGSARTMHDDNSALAVRVAELERAISAHRASRLPHMTNADDRALWSFVNL
jgi:hypothetical protein